MTLFKLNTRLELKYSTRHDQSNAYYHIIDKLTITFHTLHRKYDSVVQTASNELSFIELKALRMIYVERKKICLVFRKNYDIFNETWNQIAHSIFIVEDDDHAWMQKIINHVFSERALRDQESRIQDHVQTLIQKLDIERSKNDIVDLNEWYNYAAFDIIVDSAFEELFNTFQESIYHSWLHLIEMTWKIIIFASALKSIASSLYILCRLLLIRWMLQKEVNKFNLILNRVREWMILESSHIDLLSLIIQHNNDDTKEYMMKQEIISNVTLFIAADIKTVTTLLFALTYLLTQNERVRKRLTRKIQARFASESLITVQSVSQLQYLTTCIQETL